MNRHQEFLRFLEQVAKAYPDRELHLVMDNYATHKNTEVRDWPSAEAPSPGPRPPTKSSPKRTVKSLLTRATSLSATAMDPQPHQT